MNQLIFFIISILISLNALAEDYNSSWKVGPWQPSTKLYSCESGVKSGIKGLNICTSWIYADQRNVKCISGKCSANNKPNSLRLRMKNNLK